MEKEHNYEKTMLFLLETEHFQLQLSFSHFENSKQNSHVIESKAACWFGPAQILLSDDYTNPKLTEPFTNMKKHIQIHKHTTT